MSYRFGLIFLLVVCWAAVSVEAGIYYVAVDGSDCGSGGKEQPFASISRAHDAAAAGDTIFVGGGRYFLSSSLILTKSGKKDEMICLFAYPGEKPVLDGSKMKNGAVVRLVGASYWHIKGLEVCYGPEDGINLDKNSSHNIFELVDTHHHKDPGFYTHGPNNLILNCDSHHNFDADTNGEHADGFDAGYSHSRYNVFRGCRSWRNSDDGYDTWEGAHSRFENCWSFYNGYDDDGKLWGAEGDGNGFKLGRGVGYHIVNNCCAWGNKQAGFHHNAGKVLTLNNCTAWNNGCNYAFIRAEHKLRNCVSFVEKQLSMVNKAEQENNSWNLPVTVGRDDFLSLDYSLATGPRRPDGGLPEIDFLKLAPDSDLIDKGVDVGLPYHGRRPDLGADEYCPQAQKPVKQVQKL